MRGRWSFVEILTEYNIYFKYFLSNIKKFDVRMSMPTYLTVLSNGCREFWFMSFG